MTRTLNAYIDMSGSVADGEWLPELAAALNEWRHGAGPEESLSLRAKGFAHLLGSQMLIEDLQGFSTGEVLEELLALLHRVDGGTDLSLVWQDAAPLLAQGEDVVVLTDFELMVPRPAQAAADPRVRYRQYGVQEQRQGRTEQSVKDRRRIIADQFLAEHERLHGFRPEGATLRSPTEEEQAEQRRRDAWIDEHVVAQQLEAAQREADQAAGIAPAEEEEDGQDRAERASAEGFSGTLRELLDWLSESLCYGSVKASDPTPDDWGRMRVEVKTVTGGFSSDEHLLHRIDRLLAFRMGWQSSHAGGLRVYEFSEAGLDEHSVELLPEAQEPYEHFARVRRVRIVSPNGRHAEVLEGYADGVELFASEEPFDTMLPAGEITIRPVPAERSAWR